MRDAEEVKDWKSTPEEGIELLEVVKRARPTIMIGCSTMSGAFSKQVSFAKSWVAMSAVP